MLWLRCFVRPETRSSVCTLRLSVYRVHLAPASVFSGPNGSSPGSEFCCVPRERENMTGSNFERVLRSRLIGSILDWSRGGPRVRLFESFPSLIKYYKV